MKTVKKPTKAHKNKKVVKAHQGMAHVPKSNTTSTQPTRDLNEINARQVDAIKKGRAEALKRAKRVRPTGARLATTDVKRPTEGFMPPPPTAAGQRNVFGRSIEREAATQKEVDRRMRGNKVVQRSQADTRRRTEAEIKRRGGKDKLNREAITAMLSGKKRPEAIDPYRGMDERARRRAMNAVKSEFDEADRQVRKEMGTQRKPVRPRQPTPQPIQKPIPMRQPIKQPVAMPVNNIKQPIRQPKDFEGRKPKQPVPKSTYTDRITGPRQLFNVNSLQGRNKGGAVKKKYAEVKTLKQGGYVSRAKYGSVDNLKKNK